MKLKKYKRMLNILLFLFLLTAFLGEIHYYLKLILIEDVGAIMIPITGEFITFILIGLILLGMQTLMFNKLVKLNVDTIMNQYRLLFTRNEKYKGIILISLMIPFIFTYFAAMVWFSSISVVGVFYLGALYTFACFLYFMFLSNYMLNLLLTRR